MAKLFQRVDTLTEEVLQIAGEMRRTNDIVIALANHRHDVDGNILFTVPGSGD